MRTRAQDDGDYGEAARLRVTVHVHVSAETPVEISTFPREGRASIGFGGYRRLSDVTLFLDTAELRELRDLLSDTLTTLTGGSAVDPSTERGGGAGGEVSDRAA